MTRDYIGEIRELADRLFRDGDSIPDVADRLLTHLRTEDPDLLTGWQDLTARAALADMLRSAEASRRARARRNLDRAVFAEAATAFAANRDPEAMESFLTVRFNTETGARIPFGELRRPDLTYLATQYDLTAARAGFEAAFMRAVARRVGARTVADVFTEDELRALRRQLGIAA